MPAVGKSQAAQLKIVRQPRAIPRTVPLCYELEGEEVPTHKRVEEQIRKIEEELKGIGRWQLDPLPDAAFENMGAFGSKSMVLEQWLQFVFIPNVSQIIESEGVFPANSEVAVYAVRNLDGEDEVKTLLELLSEFDGLFSGAA